MTYPPTYLPPSLLPSLPLFLFPFLPSFNVDLPLSFPSPFSSLAVPPSLPPSLPPSCPQDYFKPVGDVLYADVSRNGEGVVEFATKEDMFAAKRKLDGSTFRNPFDSREVGPSLPPSLPVFSVSVGVSCLGARGLESWATTGPSQPSPSLPPSLQIRVRLPKGSNFRSSSRSRSRSRSPPRRARSPLSRSRSPPPKREREGGRDGGREEREEEEGRGAEEAKDRSPSPPREKEGGVEDGKKDEEKTGTWGDGADSLEAIHPEGMNGDE